MTVTKATATVLLGNLEATYDGSPKPAAATTDPSGLNVVVTYDESATAPTTPGTYRVAAVIDDPNYAGESSDSLVISPRSLGNWEANMFTPAQIDAGESAPAADPDGDGLTNLAEYALGGEPYAFTPQPAVTSDGATISITFQRPAWIGDVAFHAEAGGDFATWEQLTLEVLNPGSDPETVRATLTLPTPKPERRFLRLRFVK